MSSLTDALSSATTGSGETCKLCVTLAEIKPEDATAVRKALKNGISNERLWRLLKIHGHQTPIRHIRDHKKEGHQ